MDTVNVGYVDVYVHIQIDSGVEIDVGDVEPKIDQANQRKDRVDDKQTDNDRCGPDRPDEHSFGKLCEIFHGRKT